MKIIRKSMFETNSSSTHSLSLGRNLPENLVIPTRLEVCGLEDGRNFSYRTVQERYTVAVLMAYKANRLDDLLKALDRIGIKEKILCKSVSTELWTSYGIEATSLCELYKEDCEEYLEEILESDESLKLWLFSPESELSGEDDNYL